MSSNLSGRVCCSETQWRKIISAYKQSGLNQETFCAQKGIAKSSFYRWHSRLGGATPAAEEFVEVKVPVCAWDIELDLGCNVVLRMRRS